MNSVYKPIVSVCVATYNQERYIKDCLLSVLAQAYDVTLEVLVGDDASTDNTLEIVRDIAGKYPDIVKLFHHKKNMGGCANYQFLIERSKGTYIAHLDGDDFWMPGKLIEQVKFLENNSDCVAVYSNAVLINESKDILGAFNTPQPQHISLEYLLEKGNFLNHSSVLYREHLRYLILDFTDIFLDYRINLRFAGQGKLGYINQMLVAYRINAIGSTMVNPSNIIDRAYIAAISEVLCQNKVNKSVARSVQLEWYKMAWRLVLRQGKFTYGYNQAMLMKSCLPKQSFMLIVISFIYTVWSLYCLLPFKIIRHLVSRQKLYIYSKR